MPRSAPAGFRRRAYDLGKNGETVSTARWDRAAASLPQLPAMLTGSSSVIRCPAARTTGRRRTPAAHAATIRLRWDWNLWSSTDQLGRIDIAIAPGNAITSMRRRNPSSGIALGVATPSSVPGLLHRRRWTWAYGGLSGRSLTNCGSGPSDYPQNWVNQGVACPVIPDRVFFDTFDVWFARAWNCLERYTCGYQRSPHPVHGTNTRSPSCPDFEHFCTGNDGGVHGTTNADIVNQTTDPPCLTWTRVLTHRVLLRRHQRQLRQCRFSAGKRRVAGQRLFLGHICRHPNRTCRMAGGHWR